MKLLYAPFSIASTFIGALAGHRAFEALWRGLSDSPKPSPNAPGASLARVALAAAIEGATLQISVAVARNLTARLFHHLFGVWPERQRDDAGAHGA